MEKSTSNLLKNKDEKKKTAWRLRILTFLTALLILAAYFSKHLTPYDPNLQNYAKALQPPSAAHLMGTDRYGRDMLSRVIIGSYTSVFSTLLLIIGTTVFGTFVGVCCGYFGGLLDAVVMRFSDVFLAFPGLVFALAVAAILNGGLSNAVIALAAISWPKYSRLARSQTLTLKKTAFISAAHLSGNSSLSIIFKHILPNIFGVILVTAVLDIGTMMMEIAGLSFLGLGAQPPTAEWGSMMSAGRSMLQTYPWVVLSPGLAIFLSVVLFNLLGDTVRDVMDTRKR